VFQRLPPLACAAAAAAGFGAGACTAPSLGTNTDYLTDPGLAVLLKGQMSAAAAAAADADDA
jgi:hypothetical protein